MGPGKSRVSHFALKVCIDRVLPEATRAEAARLAIQEDPRNTPAPGLSTSPIELALLTGNKWRIGKTLHVVFLEGDPQVVEKVEEIARKWTKYANLKFEFGTGSDPEIRIAFVENGASWSYVGTEATTVGKDQPTMQLAGLTPTTSDREYREVVLHEFGHAIGCVHEHQSPASEIRWNKGAVYEFYRKYAKWSRSEVDDYVLGKYLGTVTQFSKFDPKSVMVYPIPKELTIDGFEAGSNDKLSSTDKDFIRTTYPFTDRF